MKIHPCTLNQKNSTRSKLRDHEDMVKTAPWVVIKGNEISVHTVILKGWDVPLHNPELIAVKLTSVSIKWSQKEDTFCQRRKEKLVPVNVM